MGGDTWRQVRLGDVITLQRGFDLPASERKPGRVPVVSSSGITFSHSDARVKAPGVVTGRYGTIGQVFYITEDFWPLNTTLFVKDFKGNVPRFVAYLLRSIDFASYSDKSSVPGVNRNHLHLAEIALPPISEQRAIAHILGTLDDKIELNRRMNKTLEAMARALFKSWFVDFDPVRAKVEGQQPAGMDVETAALFPAAFETSAERQIPRGWCAMALGDIANIVMGQSPPGETYNESGDGLPFYQGVRDFGFRFPSRRVYCTVPTRLAEKGDVLLSVRAPVGRLNLAGERCAIGRGIAALRLKLQPSGFLYYALKATQAKWQKFESDGTVFGSVSKSDVAGFNLVSPPQQLMMHFSKWVEPLDCRIENNERESRTLAALRDTLLPRLISGQLRVKDAERMVAEALP